MYKGKPVIVAKPPFWRHHIFPWGWYSVLDIEVSENEVVNTSGFWKPNDGGAVDYVATEMADNSGDGGSFVDFCDRD